MLSLCPSCHHNIEIQGVNIVDEQLIECPHCLHHYKIYLDPKAKQIMEKNNMEILDYMMKYPHTGKEFVHEEKLPSGVIRTFE